MSLSWRFAPVFRSPHPDQQQEDIDARYAEGYDNAHGELHDTGALSFTDQYGRKYVYHVRCGHALGGGRQCFRRAGHPEGQCKPSWEYP
jgi:hypothetical protein